MADAKEEKTYDRRSLTKRMIVATGGLNKTNQEEKGETPEERECQAMVREDREKNCWPKPDASSATAWDIKL